MIRAPLILFGSLLTVSLFGQLRVPEPGASENASSNTLMTQAYRPRIVWMAAPNEHTRVPPVLATQGQPPKPFDFTATRPHLAFFCRLEINEERGHIVPVKFRLGGHRNWQETLHKRE